MHGYKLVGLTGAAVLALGVFMPASLAGVVKYISYFTDQRNYAMIMLAMAIMAVLLLYSDNVGKLMPLAIIVLLSVGWAYQQRGPTLRELERGLNALTASATSSPIMRTVTDITSVNSMWWIMIAGGMLLLLAGLMAPRRQ